MKKLFAFLKKESLELLPPTMFFLLVLQLTVLVRTVLVSESQFSMTTSTAALIGALVIGKSILIADALPLFRWFREPKLIYNTVWRVFLYLIIVLLFQVLEELIPLVSKYGGVGAALERFSSEVNVARFWVTHLMLALFLIIWSFTTTLIDIIGRQRLLQVLFGSRT
jgi:hypothetical protein